MQIPPKNFSTHYQECSCINGTSVEGLHIQTQDSDVLKWYCRLLVIHIEIKTQKDSINKSHSERSEYDHIVYCDNNIITDQDTKHLIVL